jgi:hypothetical protein
VERLHFAIQRRLLPDFAGVLSTVLETPSDDVAARPGSAPSDVCCGLV